jgi:MerR family transcriptional regulator, mercuric resistance operon regulatory protein
MATPSTHRPFTIAALANNAGVNVETVRYYQRRGLMPVPPRPSGGVRRYADADAERLRFIKRAQAMGFTLEEVKDLLKLRARRSCQAARNLAVTKLHLIEANIRELQQLQSELTQLVAKCDSNADDSRCPVIDQLGQFQ